MSLFAVYPPESLRRSDGKNLFVISAADEAAALERAEAMCGDVEGAFADWIAFELSDSPDQDFLAGPFGPVGTRNSVAWADKLYKGDRLAI